MVPQKYKKPFVFWCIGFGILLVGIVCLSSYKAIFTAILEVKLPITKGSVTYPLWKDIPTPLYFKAYFFNVTNSVEFMANHSVIPDLDEIGPYTFRLYWNKTGIEFNPNFTVTFRENSTYIFLRNESVGDLDDQVVTLNAPMVIGGALVKGQALWKRVAISAALTLFREKLFISLSIRQLLFDGYYDPITALGRTFNPQLPDNKGYFAYFFGKNVTDDGLFVSYTGQDDMSKFNVINQWNGQSSLKYWYNESCNAISGSNAEISPPIGKHQDTLQFFRTDLCRSWTLTSAGEVDHFGLMARQFSATSMVLANSSVNPDNKCYELGDPRASGVLDISPCQYGAPIFLSQPHFYQGDPILRHQINGMKPDPSLHSFYLNVEPNSGITLTLGARTQVNLHIEPIPGVSQFTAVPDIIFPVLWQEIVGEMPENETNELKNRLIFPLTVMFIGSLCLVGLGTLLALLSSSAAYYIHRQHKTGKGEDDREPIVGNPDD